VCLHDHVGSVAEDGRKSPSALDFSIVADASWDCFYPQLMRAIGPEKLTPYVAWFSSPGRLASNFVVNTVFMKTGACLCGLLQRQRKLHAIGSWRSIWMVALCLNVIASGVPAAISYALGRRDADRGAVGRSGLARKRNLSYTVLMFIATRPGSF